MVKNLLFVTGMMMLTSFIGVPEYVAQKRGNTPKTEFYGQYDPPSKIRYIIEYDSSHVYLEFITADPGSQAKILGQGITISIDKKGEKGKFWTYPYYEPGQARGQNRGSQDLKSMYPDITQKSQIMYYQYKINHHQIKVGGFNGEKEPGVFIYPNTKIPLDISLRMDSAGVLIYSAVLPLSEIFPEKPTKTPKFLVGVKSAEPQKAGSFPQGYPGVSGGRGQGRGSGRSGGMGGSGRMGGGNSPGRAGAMNTQRNTESIDFKTEVVLSADFQD